MTVPEREARVTNWLPWQAGVAVLTYLVNLHSGKQR